MGDYALIHQIASGEFPSPCEHKAELGAAFFEALEGQDLKELLRPFPYYGVFPRVFILKRFFNWLPIPQEEFCPYTKNEEMSGIFRQIAGSALAQKNYKEALKYLNFAVAFAPYPAKRRALKEEKSKGLILSLLERATTLLAVRGGEEALRDANFLLGILERADNYENPSPFLKETIDKIKDVQTKALHFIEEKACFMLELAKDSVEELERRVKYKSLLLFKIKKPHPLHPASESFVDIKVDPVKGRCLVLNRDIPAGTSVIVEDPYVSVLAGGLKFDSGHCHACLLRIRECQTNTWT